MVNKILVFLMAGWLLILTVSTVLAENNLYLTGDFSGNDRFSGQPAAYPDSVRVDNGGSIGYEYLFQLQPNLTAGPGVEYQFQRSASNPFTGNFSFIPVYGVLNYQLKLHQFKPYVTARFGYNYLKGDCNYLQSLSGGLYWGVGLGITPGNNLSLSILYSENRGSGSIQSNSVNVVLFCCRLSGKLLLLIQKTST